MKILKTFEEYNKINENEDYRGEHTAPGKDDSPMYDLSNTYPDDIYGPNGARYYGDGGDNGYSDNISISIIKSARNNPNQKIKIYRAIPKVLTNQEKIDKYEFEKKYILKNGKLPKYITNWNNRSDYYEYICDEIEKLKNETAGENKKIEINSGDWVTINKEYAKSHGEHALNGDYRILSKTVLAKQLYTDGNSIHEWGYWE